MIFILVTSLFWIWSSRVQPGDTTEGKIPAPQQGFLAPDLSLGDVNGEIYTLTALRGKPVIINFWASWCKPCQVEMPALERISQKYSAQGLLILGINTLSQDVKNNVLTFINDLSLSFPILFDEDGSVANLYQVRALPTTFFIDKEGIIQEVVIGGPMSEALLQTRLLKLIEGGDQ